MRFNKQQVARGWQQGGYRFYQFPVPFGQLFFQAAAACDRQFVLYQNPSLTRSARLFLNHNDQCLYPFPECHAVDRLLYHYRWLARPVDDNNEAFSGNMINEPG